MSHISLADGIDNDEEVQTRYGRGVIDYYVGGSADEVTLHDNVKAWQRWRIRPTYLTSLLTPPCISCRLLNRNFSSPLAVAPVALQKMISHGEVGEIATARACQITNTLMIVSTISTTSIEDIVQSLPHSTDATNLWFQLYLYNDRDLTASLVRRAAAAGMGAIVLTVDLARLAVRERDIRNHFRVSDRFEVSNFSIPELRYQRRRPYNADASRDRYGRDAAFNWSDIPWLRSLSSLPLILKGVLSPEDAVLAAQCGCDGIIVSNHGGRQLDSVEATCDALPDITRALKPWPHFVIGVDGGVRSGASIYKAVALGAHFVLIGRAAMHGLALQGQQGVRDVVHQLRDELVHVMTQTGAASLSDITPESIVHIHSLHSRL